MADKQIILELTAPGLAAKTKQIDQAISRTTQSFDKGQKGVHGTTMAVTNFNRVISDAPYGMIGVANNIEPLISSFQTLQRETGSTTKALKTLLVSAFTGPGALITLATALPAAMIAYDKFFKSTAESAKDAAKELKEFKSVFTEIIDDAVGEGGADAIKKQEKRVKALNELWLEQTPLQERLQKQIEGTEAAIKLMGNSTKGLNEDQNRVLMQLINQKAEYERQVELSKALKETLVTDIMDAETELLALKMASNSEALKALQTEKEINEELARRPAFIKAINNQSIDPGLGSESGIPQLDPNLAGGIPIDESALQLVPQTLQNATEGLHDVNMAMIIANQSVDTIVMGVDRLGDGFAMAFANGVTGVQNFQDAFRDFGDVAKGVLRDIIAQMIKLSTFKLFGSLFGVGQVTTAAGLLQGIGGRLFAGAKEAPVINNRLFVDGQQLQTQMRFTGYRNGQLGL